MNHSKSKLMSEFKFLADYARMKDGKYETWEQAVDRVMDMHRTKYKDVMTQELSELMTISENAYKGKQILGAQRALQFGGDQLLKKNAKMYNCLSGYADRAAFFGEFMWLALCGCGVGFSVQKHHISKMPKISDRPKSVKRYVVEDSIEGWAKAFDVLLSSFFVGGGVHPEFENHPVWFDLSKIRPKGALISGGFKAPGPEPLQYALNKVEELLTKSCKSGVMKSIVIYDVCMYMADAVISGGVRRSATICMFSKDDDDMIKAKTGSWFTDNPQRGRSNNSVMLKRDEITEEEFTAIMQSVKDSGEPGFIFTDDYDFTYNPCVEIGMYPKTKSGESGWQGCNLLEINGAYCDTPEKFYECCEAGSILCTLQAGYTDFEFLSKSSKEIFEHESLIGVSVTGWMNNPNVLFDKDVMRKGAQIVKDYNKRVAGIIGINPAARTCCVKPSGNASVLLETASGIHAEHSPRYLRNVQMTKQSEVLQALQSVFPVMVEECSWSTNGTDSVVSFPIVSKEGSVYKKDMLGVKQLEYVKLAQEVWVEEGTNHELCVKPSLRHNVSNTISVDNWDDVTKYLYENRQWFCGVSLMSESGDKGFAQAPFTEVLTEDQIVNLYGASSLFASGLITRALDAFGDLWKATSCALGYGEKLGEDTHESVLKRDWVRMFSKFAKNHFNGDENKTSDCLKDVYNLHRWTKIVSSVHDIDLREHLKPKSYVDVNTLGAQGCSGNSCEISF